ncbi:MAG: efflux RND transporter periplasmic adaptor subunit [Pseudomonadota bacterium]
MRTASPSGLSIMRWDEPTMANQPPRQKPLTRRAVEQVAVVGFAFSMLTACSNAGASMAEILNDSADGRPVEATSIESWSGGETLSFVGTLSTPGTTRLGFEVPGTVLTLFGDIGERFSRSDMIATIDPAQFELAIQEARARLSAAEAELKDAALAFERREKLIGTGAISQAQFDATVARRDAAQANVQVARTALETRLDRFADTVLRAPFDGTVISRHVEAGQVVGAGAPVIEVSPVSDFLEAEVNIPEAVIGQFKLGVIYSVFVPALGQTFDGTVLEIGTEARSTLSFPLVLSIPDTDQLRAGMAVELQSQRNALGSNLQKVPNTAVRSDGRGTHYVFALDGQENRAKQVTVQPVKLLDQSYLIRSSLNVGDRIVAKGAAHVLDGETLHVVDTQATEFGS